MRFTYLLTVLLLVFSSFRVNASNSLSYSGRLVKANGSPVTSSVNLKFELAYTTPTGIGSVLCSQQLTNVQLSNGVFHVKLDPDCTPLDLTTFLAQTPAGETVAIRVTDETANKAYSYQALYSIPFAQVSMQLSKLGANTNDVLQWDGSKWAPASLGSIAGVGTVTQIDTGTGLTGGPITATGTISIANSGVNTAQLADGAVTDLKVAAGIARAKLANGTPNYVLMNNGSGVISEVAQLPIAQGGTGAANAADARTNLGLGSSAVFNYFACLPGEVSKFVLPGGWSCVVDNDSLDTTKLPLAGGTMSGAIDMGSNAIVNVAAPTNPTDAANMAYVDAQVGAMNSSQWTTVGSDIYYDSGNVGIGTNTPDRDLHIVTTGSTYPRGFFLEQINTGVQGPLIYGGKARGTPAAKTAILSGDQILNVSGMAWDGGAYYFGGGMSVIASQNHSGLNHGAYINFSTTADNTGPTEERMRISSSGNVGIGTTTPGAKLEVAGQVKITGGTPGAGKVLTSDASGLATWVAPAAGGISALTGDVTASGSGSVAATIANNAVTSGKILNGTILNEDLADTTIAYGKLNLADYEIPVVKLAKLNCNAGEVLTSDLVSGYRCVVDSSTDSTKLPLAGGTMTGAIDMGSNGILNLPAPTNPTDAANMAYVDTQVGGINSSQWTTVGSDIHYGSGNVGIGTTTPATTLHVSDEVVGPTYRGIMASNYGGTGALLTVVGARGTKASPTAIQNNNFLGWIIGTGYDGSSIATQALPTSMNFVSTENWSSTAHGSAINFYTTPNGTTVGAHRLKIDHNGNVGIGTTSPATKLEVAGQVKITGGTPGAGKVLTSDASGLATWESPAAGGISALTGDVTASGSGSVAATIANNAVTTGKILNGTILNEDIADTTIAYGKLNLADYEIPVAKLARLACNAGEVLTSDLILGYRCVADNSTDSTKLPLVGGTMTGAINMGSNGILNLPAPTNPTDAANMAYVDAQVGGINSSQWTTVGSDIHYGGGNVGIGTISPQSSLDSIGPIRSQGQNALACDAAHVGMIWFDSTADTYKICRNNGGTPTVESLSDGNSHEFRAHSIASATVGNRIVYTTEDFDISGAYSSGVYTAPEPGVYVFSFASYSGAPGVAFAQLYVNSVVRCRGAEVQGNGSATSAGSCIAKLNLNDQVEIKYLAGSPSAYTNPEVWYFSGTRISGGTAFSGSADNLGNHTATQNINLSTYKLVGNGGSSGVSIGANGNVGIGTTAPVGPLHVKSNSSSINGMITLENDTGTQTNLYTARSLLTHANKAVLENSNGILLNPTSGNVGIGTITPSTKLEVAGQVKITGGTPGAGKVLTSDASGLATWESPVSGGISALTGDVTASGSGSVAATIANNAVTSGKILNGTILNEDIADTTIAYGKLNLADYEIPVAKLARLACNAGEVLTSDLILGYRCVADNSTDSTKLPLAGGTMTGALTLAGAPTNNLHAATKQYVDGLLTSGANQWSESGGNVYRSSGNVGIGAATPLRALHISHPSAATLIIENPTNAANIKKRYISTESDGDLALGIFSDAMSPTSHMTIGSSGNVGIGVATPGSLLHVNGSIRAQELCDLTGGNCKSIASGWGNVSAATMIVNWPDAIVCDNGTDKSVIYHDTSAGNLEYYGKASGPHWLRFNATTGAYYDVTAGMAGSSICIGKSISTLIAEGRTFGLLGGGVDWTTNGTDVYRSGGKVGIGTSSPSRSLEVTDPGTVTELGWGQSGIKVNGLWPALRFSSNTSDAIIRNAEDSQGRGIQFGVNNLKGDPLTIAMHMTGAGNIGIGTSPSSKLHVESNNPLRLTRDVTGTKYGIDTTIDASRFIFNGVGPAPSSNILVLRHDNGDVGIGTATPGQALDVVGNIRTSGCLYYASSSLGTCASDERIKKDVHSFDLGLDALLGINPVKFKYNGLAGFENDGKEHLGVIAQEIEMAAPELIKTRKVQLHKNDQKKTEIKVVDYGAFTYVMINSIKELYNQWFDDSNEIHRELASVKAENAELKKENEEIKARLEHIEKILATK